MISIQVPQVILLELKYLYHLSLRLQSEITVKIHLPSLQNTGLKWGVIPSKIKLFRQIYVESSFGWQYTGLFKKRIFNNWPNLLKNIFGLILTWTRIIIQFFVTKSGFFTLLHYNVHLLCNYLLSKLNITNLDITNLDIVNFLI